MDMVLYVHRFAVITWSNRRGYILISGADAMIVFTDTKTIDVFKKLSFMHCMVSLHLHITVSLQVRDPSHYFYN